MKKLVVLVLALLMVCASMTALSDSKHIGESQSVTLKLKLEPSVIWSIPEEVNLSLTGENKIKITVQKMVCCSEVKIISQIPDHPLTDGSGHEILVELEDAPAFTAPGVEYCNVTAIGREDYLVSGKTDDFHDAFPGEYSTSVNFMAWVED